MIFYDFPRKYDVEEKATDSRINREIDKKVAELSAHLKDIQDGKYPDPTGGYDAVVQVWARLLRATLPVYSETIKSINRGATALKYATWALVAATVVIAGATIALVCVTKTSDKSPRVLQQKQTNKTQQTAPVANAVPSDSEVRLDPVKCIDLSPSMTCEMYFYLTGEYRMSHPGSSKFFSSEKS